MIETIKKVPGAVKHPVRLFRYLSRRGWLKWMHDETYIKLIYRMQIKRKLNLENPTTFNEKLQWLKINERNSKYTMMVDKIAVKDYVSMLIGNEYVVPTIGIWERADDIDFDVLPDRFVLKCNHDSSSIIVCKDKKSLNYDKVIKKMNYCLGNNGYWYGREWPYKNVKPLVFAEEYLEDEASTNNGLESLNVYKFFTFDGVPKIIQTIQNDKTPNESIDYFDCDWNLLELRQNFPNSNIPLQRPESLEEMIRLAKILGEKLPFIRIDFYEVNKRVYFSEFTFFSDDGMNRFIPDHWDKDLGDLIKL